MRALGLLERRQVIEVVCFERCRPGLLVEEHALGRNRLVGRRAEGLLLQGFAPGVVVLGDLPEALRDRFLGEMIEAHRHARQVVKQRLKVIVEQRQPMLLAGIALAGADGLVQRVVTGGAAEQLDVAAAEQLLRLLPKRDLAHRQQGHLLHWLGCPLRLHLERLDRLQRIAEEVEAHRRRAAGREQVEDAAAHCELARFHDGAAALIAHQCQPLRQVTHVDALAGRDRLDRALEECARRHPLQCGVDRRQHHCRVLARRQTEPGERRDALGHDVGVGADAVIRDRVPGWKRDDAHLRGKEGERALERVEAAVVAGDVQKRAGCAAAAGFGDELGEHERVEPLGDAGDRAVAARLMFRFVGLHRPSITRLPIRDSCARRRSAPPTPPPTAPLGHPPAGTTASAADRGARAGARNRQAPGPSCRQAAQSQNAPAPDPSPSVPR